MAYTSTADASSQNNGAVCKDFFGLAGIYDSDEAQRFNSKISQSTLTTQQDFEPKFYTTPQAYKNSKSKNMGTSFVKEWVKRENEIAKS